LHARILTIVFVPGCTLTLPTANLETVTAAVPLLPSLVAVIVAVPSATALSIPCGEMVAIALSELAQVTARPVSTTPFASRATADNCVDCVTDIARGLGRIATVATGACVTETVEMSLFPSTVPVIVAEPGATAVTIPLASTVATPELLVVHVIVRSDRAFCAAS
jgi:hypothetical protein